LGVRQSELLAISPALVDEGSAVVDDVLGETVVLEGGNEEVLGAVLFGLSVGVLKSTR
jgi:hypothetical protein